MRDSSDDRRASRASLWARSAADILGGGYNHTYSDPPVYYLVTAPLASLVQTVTGVDSVVSAARRSWVLLAGAGLLESLPGAATGRNHSAAVRGRAADRHHRQDWCCCWRSVPTILPSRC